MFDVVLWWETVKDWLSGTLHLSHLALHLILGLALFPLFARLMRRPLTSALPLLPIALLELLNEVSDYTRYAVPGWPWSPSQAAIDVAATLLPPLALMLAARAVRPLRRPATR